MKQKKTLLLTGTSRGIGKQTSLIFLKNGIQVLGISRKKDEELFVYPNYFHHDFDLMYLEKIESLVGNFPEINWVIHNAGYLVNKPFLEISPENFQRIYTINVFAVAEINRQLIRQNKLNSDAHLVHISSMGGVQGSAKFAGLTAYSSSKMGMQGVVEVLAEEYKETGWRFNGLALGAVQTEMLREAFPDFQAPISPEQMADFIFDFTTKSGLFFNGKILPVASTTP